MSIPFAILAQVASDRKIKNRFLVGVCSCGALTVSGLHVPSSIAGKYKNIPRFTCYMWINVRHPDRENLEAYPFP